MIPLSVDSVLAIIIAYLFGSISSAVLVCQFLKLPDPRSQGSGNPGATNVLRFGGKKAAIATLIGDILKSVIPILLARWYGLDTFALACVAFAAFLGHLFPIFFGFRGGKGVATALGCIIALSFPAGVALLLTWLVIAMLFRYSSLAAMVTALLSPLYCWYFANTTYALLATAIAAILIARHHTNLRQLIAGTEKKIGQ